MFWKHRVEDVVHVAASIVGATEAAAFRLRDMAVLVHIRPDESDAAVRAAAIAAFKELIQQTNGKDAAIEVDPGVETQSRVLSYARHHTQFCLIAFPSRGSAADAVVAVIMRCADDQEAARKLERLQEILLSL